MVEQTSCKTHFEFKNSVWDCFLNKSMGHTVVNLSRIQFQNYCTTINAGPLSSWRTSKCTYICRRLTGMTAVCIFNSAEETVKHTVFTGYSNITPFCVFSETVNLAVNGSRYKYGLYNFRVYFRRVLTFAAKLHSEPFGRGCPTDMMTPLLTVNCSWAWFSLFLNTIRVVFHHDYYDCY